MRRKSNNNLPAILGVGVIAAKTCGFVWASTNPVKQAPLPPNPLTKQTLTTHTLAHAINELPAKPTKEVSHLGDKPHRRVKLHDARIFKEFKKEFPILFQAGEVPHNWDDIKEKMNNSPDYADAANNSIFDNFSSEVSVILLACAKKENVSALYLAKVALLESGGDPKISCELSSAEGLFQFIDATAEQWELKDRFDPLQATMAEIRLTKHNQSYLKEHLGREAADVELYLAHQQGAVGVVALIEAAERNDPTPAIQVRNTPAIMNNLGTATHTSREFIEIWEAKLDIGKSDPASHDVSRSMNNHVTAYMARQQAPANLQR